MNIELLEKIVREADDTFTSLAEDLNIGEEEVLIKRLRDDIGSVEIKLIRDRYNLTDGQVNDIFFD